MHPVESKDLSASAVTHSDASVGILLTNLGTPDAPTAEALRRYLREFLWDRRVVDLPRVLWWCTLHGPILHIRPRRSARLYQAIWTAEGSPLLVISRRQAAGLERSLRARLGQKVCVALGMRYGNPSLRDALDELIAGGCRRILVFPLYPQYCGATTESTRDAVTQITRKLSVPIELGFVEHYFDAPDYLDALAASIREGWAGEDASPYLLISFHGLPLRYIQRGDPYLEQCRHTADALAERLGLKPWQWTLGFQSRFGPGTWLEPNTHEVIEQLARQGTRRLDVICPGFSADCLETLEEIARQGARRFREAGGEQLRYISALNDRPGHIEALAAIAARHLADWLPPCHSGSGTS